MNIELYY